MKKGHGLWIYPLHPSPVNLTATDIVSIQTFDTFLPFNFYFEITFSGRINYTTVKFIFNIYIYTVECTETRCSRFIRSTDEGCFGADWALIQLYYGL